MFVTHNDYIGYEELYMYITLLKNLFENNTMLGLSREKRTIIMHICVKCVCLCVCVRT